MSDAKHSNPIEIEITEPSSLNEQAAVALVIVGALVAVADRQVSPVERDEVVRSSGIASWRRISRTTGSTRCSTSLLNDSRSRISPMW